MSDWIDQFLFYDDLDDDARAQFRAALSSRVEVAQAFEEWKAFQAALRENVEPGFVDRKLLVHYAMWRNGNASLLSPEELGEVEVQAARLSQLLVQSPALRQIVENISVEQDDFEAIWRVHAGTTGGASVSHISVLERLRERRGRHGLVMFAWRAAAAIAVISASTLLYVGIDVNNETIVVRSSDHGVRTVILDDGSVVRLVDDAELSYRIPTQEEPFNRRVSLKGKALFRVTPGSQQFVVETPAAVTTVWGTTFGLDSDESFTEVVLAEGRVSVVSRRDSQQPVVLAEGEMTRVVGGRRPTIPTPVNVTDALGWTRLFVFRNEMTIGIADRLGKHFGVQIDVHPDLAQETVTGTFEKSWSLGYVLQTVARALDAEVTGSAADGFEIKPLGLAKTG